MLRKLGCGPAVPPTFDSDVILSVNRTKCSVDFGDSIDTSQVNFDRPAFSGSHISQPSPSSGLLTRPGKPGAG